MLLRADPFADLPAPKIENESASVVLEKQATGQWEAFMDQEAAAAVASGVVDHTLSACEQAT